MVWDLRNRSLEWFELNAATRSKYLRPHLVLLHRLDDVLDVSDRVTMVPPLSEHLISRVTPSFLDQTLFLSTYVLGSQKYVSSSYSALIDVVVYVKNVNLCDTNLVSCYLYTVVWFFFISFLDLR